MLPTLFSIGNFSVSTFGLFLAAAFLYGIYLVWRLARGWELNEERVLDLILITFAGGLIGARLFYALENPAIGMDFSKILLIHKFPGFSFWGGLLGSGLTLFLFTKKAKIDFWQAADIASVGFLGAFILSSLGCLLGGCDIGIQSNLFFALPVVGLLGKRIPVSLIEAILFFIVLKKVWSQAIHFHPRGKIISLSFIFTGLIKLITEPLREDKNSYFFSLTLVILGLIIFYQVTKRNILQDIKGVVLFPLKFIADSRFRKTVIVSINKGWYNQRILFILKFKNLFKKIRRLNVGFSHKNSKYYQKRSS